MPYSDIDKRREKGRMYSKTWRIRNTQKVRIYHQAYCKIESVRKRIRDNKRAAHYKRVYNITLGQLQEMKTAQHGRCKLCNEKRPLVVDHCHNTKRVRGLLCHFCNRQLGMWEKWTKEGKFETYVRHQ